MLEDIKNEFDVLHLTNLGQECQHINPKERPSMQQVPNKLDHTAKNVSEGGFMLAVVSHLQLFDILYLQIFDIE